MRHPAAARPASRQDHPINIFDREDITTMSAAFACLIALSLPAATEGQLQIVNARGTYGYLGATRPKGSGVLPGEIAFYTFDIKNIKLDDKGRASYSMLVEGLDPKGQLAFRLGPHNATAQCYLGGNTLPCSAHMEIPPQMTPGTYTLRVTVEDRLANKKATFEGKGTVLPAGFGLVRVGTFADRELKVPTAPVGAPGQSLFIGFAPVGFARAKDTGQPDLKVSLRVLDEKKQATMPAPLGGRVHEHIPADALLVPLQFGLTLNRPGQFIIELTAADQVSGRRAQVTLPLRVLPAK
jgi:hypothetical protein